MTDHNPTGEAFRQFEYLTLPLQADLSIKERALARTQPANVTTSRYRPPDKLLAFLEAL